MTIFFQSHEITIYRHRRKAATNRYAFSATLTAYMADIQPSSVERAESLSGKYGALFDAYVDTYVSIKEGDQLVDGNGRRYSVRAITTYQGAGLLDYQQLVIESQDANAYN